MLKSVIPKTEPSNKDKLVSGEQFNRNAEVGPAVLPLATIHATRFGQDSVAAVYSPLSQLVGTRIGPLQRSGVPRRQSIGRGRT